MFGSLIWHAHKNATTTNVSVAPFGRKSDGKARLAIDQFFAQTPWGNRTNFVALVGGCGKRDNSSRLHPVIPLMVLRPFGVPQERRCPDVKKTSGGDERQRRSCVARATGAPATGASRPRCRDRGADDIAGLRPDPGAAAEKNANWCCATRSGRSRTS